MNEISDLERRLEELEVRLAFQDDTIQKLNDVIVQQNAAMHRLTGDVNDLKDKVNASAPSIVADETQETPPPHY